MDLEEKSGPLVPPNSNSGPWERSNELSEQRVILKVHLNWFSTIAH